MIIALLYEKLGGGKKQHKIGCLSFELALLPLAESPMIDSVAAFSQVDAI